MSLVENGAVRGAACGPLPEPELWRRHTDHRDEAAREALFGLYMPMARRMAGRYAGVAEPLDDLVQVASLGLLNAIDRFDPGRGTPFAGFAKPTILGELKRYFRDKVWTVRVPRSVHDRMAEVEKTTEALTLELRRPPSVDELAEELGIPAAEVLEVLEAQHNRRRDHPPAPSSAASSLRVEPLSACCPGTAENRGGRERWTADGQQDYEGR